MIDLQTIGHGHVVKRDDGFLARCGGPAECTQCQLEEYYAATVTGEFAIDCVVCKQRTVAAGICGTCLQLLNRTSIARWREIERLRAEPNLQPFKGMGWTKF